MFISQDMNRTTFSLRRISTIKMAARPPPPRRYPVARSKNAVPSIEFPNPASKTANLRNEDSQGSQPRRTLIYFIPGNPGLAGYYVPFLKTLRGLLDASSTRARERGEEIKVEFDILSRNLLGFDDADHEPPFGTRSLTRTDLGGVGEENLPFCLEDQICAVWDFLEELVAEKQYDEVILMGHSVGAYIGMEVFHRHHLQLRESSRSQGSEGAEIVPFTLKAGIMLFPTVWDIAQSPNGVKFDALIRNNAFMDRNAHFIARWIVDLFPGWFLRGIVRRVMAFSENGADITTQFLQSRDGIWQALYLAKDEMGVITSERWEREMWEARRDSEEEGEGEGEGDRFFFLFGQKDHWVADKTRDAFIEKREGHDEGRVKVLVEETGKVPHAFCIHHSEVVAERVKTWIDEIARLR